MLTTVGLDEIADYIYNILQHKVSRASIVCFCRLVKGDNIDYIIKNNLVQSMQNMSIFFEPPEKSLFLP